MLEKRQQRSMNKAYLLEKCDHRIQHALTDNTIGEIILNSDGKLWLIDHYGNTHHAGCIAAQQAMGFVHALAQFEKQYLNDKTPYLDAILPFNGERINVRIPPITKNVSFNIRKKSLKIYSLQEYVEKKSVTQNQAAILTQAIMDRKNILVSGSPASGKTTLTNALLDTMSRVMPDGHRVLLLEQIPELQCNVSNLESFLTSAYCDMNKLLWTAMRSSPDCLVVGEVRDGAALDLLKAWNTGCHGGVATIHANHARAAVQRLLDLSCEVSVTPPYTLIAEAVDIIVHIQASKKNNDAKRQVTEIVAIDDFDVHTKEYQFKKLDNQEKHNA